jgi:hypothetical protein
MPHLPAEIILVFTPCAPLFSAHVWRHAPRGTPGCAADARGAHRDGRPAGDGVGGGAPLHDRSAGLEPGEVVGPPRESDAAQEAAPAPSSPKRDERPGRRRSRGTPDWAADQGPKVLSR